MKLSENKCLKWLMKNRSGKSVIKWYFVSENVKCLWVSVKLYKSINSVIEKENVKLVGQWVKMRLVNE